MNIRTTSVDETRELGAALASLARPGDLVLLVGDLGAGKTALAQGYARALGVTEPVTSPTFVLARQYDGDLTVNHLDVYRLVDLREVSDLGLPDLLDDGGVTLIEWGDAIVPALPPTFLEVRLTFGDGDDERAIAVRPVGSAWVARANALERALAPFGVSGAC